MKVSIQLIQQMVKNWNNIKSSKLSKFLNIKAKILRLRFRMLVQKD